MLLKKYEPRSLREMLGNKEQASAIEKFIAGWKQGQCLMIYGPTGCGKSLTIRLVAKQLNAELVESHASDDRTLTGIQKNLKESVSQRSLLSRKKIILIEDVDMMESTKALSYLIQSSRFPVILVAHDPYSQKLYELKKRCSLLAFKKIRTDSIANLLENIVKKEALKCSSSVGHIARTSGGDVRAAVNDLSSMGEAGSRSAENDIFNTLKIIFKTKRMENVNSAIKESEKLPEDILLWLEWNITEEYEKPEEIFRAFDWLSKADIFSSRIIRRQSWSLAKYSFLGIAGVALSKDEMYRKFVRYNYPRMIWKKAGNEKLAPILHVSLRKMREYEPLLDAMEKNNKL